MESARHRAGRAAHAADKNVLQPVIQQTQHTAADTKRWLQSMVSTLFWVHAYSVLPPLDTQWSCRWLCESLFELSV